MKLGSYLHWMIFTIGYILFKTERWREAAYAFRRARELKPDHPWAHNHLAIALLKLGLWEEAAAVSQCAMGLNPRASDSYMYFGIALLKLARWDEAAVAYERAIGLDPGSAPLHEKYGAALSKLERWEEAASAYRRALQLDPTDSESYTHLATAIAELGSSTEPLAVQQQAVALAPHDAVAHLSLAIELLKLERWTEAVSVLQQGCSLVPDSASFHFLLVSPLMKLGRAQEAVAAHRRAVALEAPLPSLPGGDAASKFERRRASFWTPENLGVEVFRVERWLERMACTPAPSSTSTELERAQAAAAPASAPRLLFVLDNDYGELTTLMYLGLGQRFLDQTTVLLPDRLNAQNANALPGRTHRYASLEDVVEVVERERPRIVFLCSGYLFSIHKIFSLDELERLVRLLRDRGCRIVTSDPFLGMLSKQDPRKLVSIDIPKISDTELIKELRKVKKIEDERLRTHFSRCETILREADHLYPAYCDVPQSSATSTDSRNMSFYNSKLVCPESVLGKKSRAPANGAGKAHWVFILSQMDWDIQTLSETHSGFLDIVAGKLVETLVADRHPILVAPNDFIQFLSRRMPTTEGIDLLPYCPFTRLMSLSLSAEYVFYWNVLSHSILIRLFNKRPVVVFDRGHLVRNVTALYGRVVQWYYQGWEPPFLDHRQSLTLEAVSAHAEAYRQESDRMCERFRRAPTPAQLIQNLAGVP